MAELVNSTISGRDLYSDTDRIFEDETVPTSGSVTSSIFDFGKTLDALELVGTAVSGVTDITAVQYEYSENSDMSGSTTIDLAFTAAPADGDEIFRYAADHKKPVYARVIVTGGASGAGTFDADIASVRKG